MSGRISRREFLKYTGLGGATALASAYGLPLSSVLAQAPPNDTAGHLVIYNFGIPELYQLAIDRFNERYPNVTVEALYIPSTEGWGGYQTNLALRMRSGQQTDIMATAIEVAHEAIAQDILLPLDDIVSAEPDLQTVLDDSHPALRDALLGADGHTYYITREWNNMIMHYSPSKFEAAGLGTPAPDWTWDDFLEATLALTTGEGEDKVFGYVLPWFFFGYTPWFYTNGTSVLTDDWRQSNLDDPKVMETVQFLHDLVYKHGVAPNVEGADQTGLFTSGRAAIVSAGRWPFNTYHTAEYDDVDIVHWPRNRAATTVFGSGGWAVTRTAENIPLAIELIKDLASLETDADMVAYRTSMPARPETVQTEEFLSFPAHANYFWESLDDIKPVPSPPNFAAMQEIVHRHLSDIMANNVEVEAGLEAAHTELSAEMATLDR